MQLSVGTRDDRSAVSARAALGNWLSGTDSVVNIYAAPAIEWSWNVMVYDNWGESAGWLGFVVQSFDRKTGNDIDTVLSQQIPIWDRQLSASGPFGMDAAFDQGSTTGYPLSARFFGAAGRFYTIWIWFGAYAAEGDLCYANFPSIAVPYFSWTMAT